MTEEIKQTPTQESSQTASHENAPARAPQPNPFEVKAEVQREDRRPPSGEAEANDGEMEYVLKCPDSVPQSEVEIHCRAFKQAGIEPDKAQKVVDALIKEGEEHWTRLKEEQDRSLKQDKNQLQKELGADFASRSQEIVRYCKEVGISPEEMNTLVASLGFKRTFYLFDQSAQVSKESLAGDTVSKGDFQKTSALRGADGFYQDKDFYRKLDKGDAEVTKRLREYALSKARGANEDIY